jgi:uncharacterized damage-inducible protein DinB
VTAFEEDRQLMNQETQELLRYLDMERNHVLGILEGFSEEQLRRPVLPSAWSCLGMVKHLALADEHYWFRCVVGGASFDFGPEGPNAEWQLEPGESAEDIFSLYRDEIERANAIIAATPLDTVPRQLDPRWGEWGKSFTSLRIVMLHVLKETACHAGHLDAASELLDGRQWIVLDDR